MVKQSVQFKWTDVEKVAFNDIKSEIAHAPSKKSWFEKDYWDMSTQYHLWASDCKGLNWTTLM